MAATSEGVVACEAVLAEDALRSQERMPGNVTTIVSIKVMGHIPDNLGMCPFDTSLGTLHQLVNIAMDDTGGRHDQ